jgi:hypothetical protein
MSRRGLFISFDGLPETVYDSQVLIHVREMRQRGLVDFDVWAFACTADLYRRSLARVEQASRLSGGTVRVLRCLTTRPSMPASALLNAFLVERLLRRSGLRVDVIHARGDYATAVCAHLKRMRDFELVWDCRGDSIAEFRATYEGWRDPISVLRRGFGTIVLRQRLLRAARSCDQAIFVSEALRAATGFAGGEVIPCAASEALFYFDPELRRVARQHLGFPEETKILIFSGSLTHYQCLPETVGLFRKLHQRDPATALVVLTPDAEAARAALRDVSLKAVRVHSVAVEGVNAFLNAADFGVMLRRDEPLNRVAAPTKFAEYCLAGLSVLLNPGVTEMYTVARELNLAVDCPIDGAPPALGLPDLRRRSQAASRARLMLSREAIRPKYEKIYGSSADAPSHRAADGRELRRRLNRSIAS